MNDGITYPTIKIKEQEYTVKVASGAVVRLKSLFGLEFSSLKQSDSPADNIAQTLKILYACIGYQTELSFEAFCDKIELSDLQAASKSITDALLKVSSQAQEKKAESLQVQ